MELGEREGGREEGRKDWRRAWKGGGGKRGRIEEREGRGREEGEGIRGRRGENKLPI